jgi:glycosyltransferase involved in cell wall biosynthesis
MLFSTLEDAYITVITATYNSSRFLEKSLVSLLEARKNIPNTQIAHLVVDGYSTDATLDIVRRCSPSSIIVQREKAGIYDALNYGVSLVQSPYLMYLHSDDELDAKFLAEMVRVISRFHKEGKTPESIFYGTVDFIDADSQCLYSRRPPYYNHLFQRHSVEGPSIIFHPNAVYSTAIEKEYPYSTRGELCADQLHIVEIAQMCRLLRVPKARYRFRFSSESTSSMQPEENVNLMYFYIKLFENRIFKRIALKILANRTYCSDLKSREDRRCKG